MCEKLANMNKIVIIAALDGTYLRKGFGNVLSLVPIAESIVKLTAVCMQCFGDAAFTYRKSADKAVEVIGGTEKYMALCRVCYQKNTCDVKPDLKRKALGVVQFKSKALCNLEKSNLLNPLPDVEPIENKEN